MPQKEKARLSVDELHKLKVALVYDRANTAYGGAEQVLLTFKKMFPDLVLFTSVHDQRRAAWTSNFEQVQTSFLNRLPLIKNRHQWLTPLMPLAFESLDLSEFEIVISVTSAEAKGVITKPHQIHLCYLLTPPRYLYDFQNQYLKTRPLLKVPLLKQVTSLSLKYLCWWDQRAVHRPDIIIPLSQSVKERAKRTYDIEISNPIYPPVDAISLKTNDAGLAKLNLPKKFNLMVTRLVFYKRVGLAIQAAAALDQNLVVVGSGQQERTLKKMAQQLTKNTDSQIIFLGNQSQPIVNSLMKAADVVLAPGIDDFGLSPLQANLFNTPAIINAQSGVAEVFDKYGRGEVIMQANLENLIQAMQTSSLEVKKSANIGHVKLDLGQKAFINNIKKQIDSYFKADLS